MSETIELVTVADLGRRWKKSRHAAWRTTNKPNFPKPFAETSHGKLWQLADVIEWEAKKEAIAAWERGETAE